MRDDLGDRMKNYEAFETGRRLQKNNPIYIRIDGRAFSKFTRGMERPYDMRMSDAMIRTTEYLVDKTDALIGYVQSDEISLVLDAVGPDGEHMFGGKAHKLTSVLASMAAAKFAQSIRGWEPYQDRLPAFDARVLNVPSSIEAVNMLRWRYLDATRNAIQMVAQANFSHRELQGVSTNDVVKMLSGIGVEMSDFPMRFRYGAFIRKEPVWKELTSKELAKIPEDKRPTGLVRRSTMMTYCTKDFMKLSNPYEVIFHRQTPQVKYD